MLSLDSCEQPKTILSLYPSCHSKLASMVLQRKPDHRRPFHIQGHWNIPHFSLSFCSPVFSTCLSQQFTHRELISQGQAGIWPCPWIRERRPLGMHLAEVPAAFLLALPWCPTWHDVLSRPRSRRPVAMSRCEQMRSKISHHFQTLNCLHAVFV